MFLAIFHHASRRVVLGERGAASPFGHTFGGSADYAGLADPDGGPPVHLLFRLDTADPAVGATVPTARWLPLLCAVRYGACALGYRVVSDAAVEVLYRREQRPWPGFPSDNYPDRLPGGPLALRDGGYDPGDPQSAHFYGDVFGYGGLTAAQLAAVTRHVEEKSFHTFGGWETAADYIEFNGGFTFAQGRPADACPDPACGNHGRAGSLRVFAVFREGEADARGLWGESGEDLQIVYQVCPACSAVLATNQCT